MREGLVRNRSSNSSAPYANSPVKVSRSRSNQSAEESKGSALGRLSGKDSRRPTIELQGPIATIHENENEQDENAEEEVSFPVYFLENEFFQNDDEAVLSSLIVIRGTNGFDGGFRIIPKNAMVIVADLFHVLWKDSADIDCSDESKIVLGYNSNSSIRFKSEADFFSFKTLHHQFKPKKDMFAKLNLNLLAREYNEDFMHSHSGVQ